MHDLCLLAIGIVCGLAATIYWETTDFHRQWLRCIAARRRDIAALIPDSRWVLRNHHSDDPFGRKDYPPVRITEIREGWVRYDRGIFFSDERLSIPDFLLCYESVPIKEPCHESF